MLKHQQNKFLDLETQQAKGSKQKEKTSIILYRTISQYDPKEYKFDYYPPPQHLRPPLDQNIKAILANNGSLEIQDVLKQQEQQQKIQLEKRFNTKEDKKTFINPKSIDIQNKSKCSRIQKQFINTYKELFSADGKQTINEHPNAVSAILYADLSASAVASYKWSSVAAKKRLADDHPQCPELKNYPLSPRAIASIESIKKKVGSERSRLKAHKSNEINQLQEIEDKLILQNSSALKPYLQNIKLLQGNMKSLYNTSYEEYKDVLEYCNATKEDFNKYDINQAARDIQFIKESKERFNTNPDLWVQSRKDGSNHGRSSSAYPDKIIANNNQARRFHKKQYTDPEEIYQTMPNKLQNSNLILGQKLSEGKQPIQSKYMGAYRKPILKKPTWESFEN